MEPDQQILNRASPDINKNTHTIYPYKRNTGSIRNTVLLAIGWNVLSIIVFIKTSDIIFGNKDLSITLIVATSILIGIGLIVHAYSRSNHDQRFGDSKLSLQSYPVRLNAPIHGNLILSGDLDKETKCRVTVECIHQLITETDDGKGIRETIKWSDSQDLSLEHYASNGKQSLPFAFMMPKYNLISDTKNLNDEIFWRLTVRSEIPGPDLDIHFELYVIKEDVDKQNSDNAMPSGIKVDNGNLNNTRAIYKKTESGSHYFISPVYNKRDIIINGGVLAILIFIIILCLKAVPMFSVVVGLIAIPALMDLIDKSFYTTELNVKYNEIKYRSGVFKGKTQTLKRADVKRFYKRRFLKTKNSFTYTLFVDTHDGKKSYLAKHINGPRDAEQLFDRIRNEFWLKDWKDE